MAEKPRICVTGASGFIGSHLVASLKADGYWVRAVDCNLRTDRRPLYEQADEVDLVDLRSETATRAALKDCTHVYHLAADHGGAGYFHSENDQPAARNNMQIDLNVLGACEFLSVERMFYASSFCAYPMHLQHHKQTLAGQVVTTWTTASGLDHKRPLRLSEDRLYQGEPEQCYGMEKMMMTRLCQDAPFARCGVFATIYGPGQESEGIRAKFPTAITRRALESTGGPIELWGDGTQIRTFLYIEDAIQRIRAIMESETYEGPVNVASDEEVTVLQCAEWACENAGVQPIFDFRDDMPTGVQARTPDNSKAQHLYGPLTQTPAKEGFRLLSESMQVLEKAA